MEIKSDLNKVLKMAMETIAEDTEFSCVKAQALGTIAVAYAIDRLSKVIEAGGCNAAGIIEELAGEPAVKAKTPAEEKSKKNQKKQELGRGSVLSQLAQKAETVPAEEPPRIIETSPYEMAEEWSDEVCEYFAEEIGYLDSLPEERTKKMLFAFSQGRMKSIDDDIKPCNIRAFADFCRLELKTA